MATTFPYISSNGPIVKAVERFRKQFPSEVTADTLRKLGIAPKNESYVINIFRFLGLIDEAGKKLDAPAKAFLLDDAKFKEEFALIVKNAYKDVFSLFGEDAWSQPREELVNFFRTADSTSDVVGKRQATAFQGLAALAGHGEIATPRVSSGNQPKPSKKSAKTPSAPQTNQASNSDNASSHAPNAHGTPADASRKPNTDVGLTVRVEVNLPANGDQATYDAIFASIRKNLIEGA